jgi:hypothetical protein
MTKVKMKAIDTLHVSSVGAHSLLPGEEFEVSKTEADELEKRGLATLAGDTAVPEEKMQPAPANKARQAASNKAA